MNEKLKTEFNEAMSGFITVLAEVRKDQLNIVPFEGSWTAGELAQHVLLSSAGFAEILNGPTKETKTAPDEKIQTIRDIFLNFEIKMKSPDFIFPEKKDYDKDVLIATLTDVRKQTGEAINKNDLTRTCTAFELPGMGFLTGMEAVSFVSCHTLRHTHQMQNIVGSLAKK